MALSFYGLLGSIRRQSFPKLLYTDISSPNEWDVHPKDSSGKEEEVLLVPLDPVIHANEYKKVANEVRKTSPITITKIQRVQNNILYRGYMVRKRQMEQRKGSNERTLFHGAAEGSCASVNKTGFNRSYCGKNGMFQLKFTKFTRTCKVSHFFSIAIFLGQFCPRGKMQ